MNDPIVFLEDEPLNSLENETGLIKVNFDNIPVNTLFVWRGKLYNKRSDYTFSSVFGMGSERSWGENTDKIIFVFKD